MSDAAKNDDSPSEFGIQPQHFYRKTEHETRKIIGLGPTQTDVAIRSGDLPPLVHLTEGGRGSGWYGFQLQAVIRKRLEQAQELAKAQAQARAAERMRPNPKETAKAKPTADKKKRTKR